MNKKQWSMLFDLIFLSLGVFLIFKFGNWQILLGVWLYVSSYCNLKLRAESKESKEENE